MEGPPLRAGLTVVCDTNVWIDLDEGGVLRRAFRTALTFTVPDYLFEELQRPDGDELGRLGLGVLEVSSRGVAEVERLLTLWPQPSVADMFALVLAKEHAWTLVTRDAELRDAAQAEGVRVADTLDLVGYMVECGALSPTEAIQALHDMEAAGRRLPEPRVSRVMKRLRG